MSASACLLPPSAPSLSLDPTYNQPTTQLSFSPNRFTQLPTSYERRKPHYSRPHMSRPSVSQANSRPAPQTPRTIYMIPSLAEKTGILSDGTYTSELPSVQYYLQQVRRSLLQSGSTAVPPAPCEEIYALAAYHVRLNFTDPAHWMFWSDNQRRVSRKTLERVICPEDGPSLVAFSMQWGPWEETMINGLHSAAHKAVLHGKAPWFKSFEPVPQSKGAGGSPQRVTRQTAKKRKVEEVSGQDVQEEQVSTPLKKAKLAKPTKEAANASFPSPAAPVSSDGEGSTEPTRVSLRQRNRKAPPPTDVSCQPSTPPSKRPKPSKKHRSASQVTLVEERSGSPLSATTAVESSPSLDRKGKVKAVITEQQDDDGSDDTPVMVTRSRAANASVKSTRPDLLSHDSSSSDSKRRPGRPRKAV